MAIATLYNTPEYSFSLPGFNLFSESTILTISILVLFVLPLIATSFDTYPRFRHLLKVSLRAYSLPNGKLSDSICQNLVSDRISTPYVFTIFETASIRLKYIVILSIRLEYLYIFSARILWMHPTGQP